ncbi:MAG: RDD family protein [Actinomycetota bacterium]
MSSDLVPLLPKVPPERRAAAFAIDAVAVGFPSLLLGGNWFVEIIFFVLLWLILRVFLTTKNQGQSLGRWALDMRVVDTVFNRTPGVQELCKREALLGICTALAVIGLGGITSTNAAVLLLMLPLALDGGVALADSQRYPQAFHDRLARTIVVGTSRGYSLDIKLKKLLDQLQRNVRR